MRSSRLVVVHHTWLALVLPCVSWSCRESSSPEVRPAASIAANRPSPSAARQRVSQGAPPGSSVASRYSTHDWLTEYTPPKNSEEIRELVKLTEEDSDFACARSYVQTKAALRAHPPQVDRQPAPDLDFTKDDFMSDCRALPTGVQKCTVFEYALTKNEYCKAERAKYDEPRTRTTTEVPEGTGAESTAPMNVSSQ